MKRTFWYVVCCLILLLAGGCWWFFATVGESDKPVISTGEDYAVIGMQKILRSPLRSGRGPAMRKSYHLDNQPRIILRFPREGVCKIFRRDAVVKLHDGPPLILTAVDHSFWKNPSTIT